MFTILCLCTILCLSSPYYGDHLFITILCLHTIICLESYVYHLLFTFFCLPSYVYNHLMFTIYICLLWLRTINSVSSTKNAKFMSIDNSNFYIQIRFPRKRFNNNSNREWILLCWDPKSHVRAKRKLLPSKYRTEKDLIVTGLWSIEIYTRIVYPQNTGYCIFTGRWRLWGQI